MNGNVYSRALKKTNLAQNERMFPTVELGACGRSIANVFETGVERLPF